MRYLITLALIGLTLSSQAYACRDPNSGNTVFFESIPNPQPVADLIAEVSLSDVDEEARPAKAVATVKIIHHISDARIREGERLVMRYGVSSCGPDLVNSRVKEGMIIARVSADSDGRLVLYPYIRTYDNRRVTPPSMSK